MNSLFIPADCEQKKNRVLINGQYESIFLLDGKEFLGPLAPFTLNPVQTCFRQFYTGGNAVVATPTGSGKTVIAFLAIFQNAQHPKRTLYLSPTRALARQVFSELKNHPFKTYLRTGENKMEVKPDFQVVVATPEAFLAARHSNAGWVSQAEMVVVDEAHMLIQGGRGIVYEEAIIHAKADGKKLLLLSATMPDSLEMARWVDAELLIEGDWRPVPLKRAFIKVSAPSRKNAAKIARELLEKGLDKNLQANMKTMIIIPSKKSGWYLLQAFEHLSIHCVNETVPFIKRQSTAAPRAAFHNADVPLEEKEIIEKAFRDPNDPLCLLISTQTLAYGFNSPADDIYIFVKYSSFEEDRLWPRFIDLLQFEGRAGRKGFTRRGYGQVLYSTGATGTKTREILEEKLQRGLDQALVTALDRSFLNLSQSFNPRYSDDLGNVELAVLGILSVDPARLEHLHYAQSDRNQILRSAISRLMEIEMISSSGTISALGKLTASYMFNPEMVARFLSQVQPGESSRDTSRSFWNLWKSLALLLPSRGNLPGYYPPFLPFLSGGWDPLDLCSADATSAMVQQGLGGLALKIGLASEGESNFVRRQRPPAWTYSLYNEMDLVLSFFHQGARTGFWDSVSKEWLERIRRSFAFGVHPSFSLLTRFPGVGAIRANILAWAAMCTGIEEDSLFFQQALATQKGLKQLWNESRSFLQGWYNTQVQWLKQSQEFSGHVSIDHLLELDHKVFLESPAFFDKDSKARQIQQEIASLQPLDAEGRTNPVPALVKRRFADSFLFLEWAESGDILAADFITGRIVDPIGAQKGFYRQFAPGRLPPKSVLELVQTTAPLLVSDGSQAFWVE